MAVNQPTWAPLVLYVGTPGEKSRFDKKSRVACDDMAWHFHFLSSRNRDLKMIVILAGHKRPMERARDYLVKKCDVPIDHIELSSPAPNLPKQTQSLLEFIWEYRKEFIAESPIESGTGHFLKAAVIASHREFKLLEEVFAEEYYLLMSSLIGLKLPKGDMINHDLIPLSRGVGLAERVKRELGIEDDE